MENAVDIRVTIKLADPDHDEFSYAFGTGGEDTLWSNAIAGKPISAGF